MKLSFIPPNPPLNTKRLTKNQSAETQEILPRTAEKLAEICLKEILKNTMPQDMDSKLLTKMQLIAVRHTSDKQPPADLSSKLDRFGLLHQVGVLLQTP